MPMLIGIDASRANKKQKTGVEWYAFHLIQALKQITLSDGNHWVLYTREPLTGGLEDLPENWYEVRAGWSPKYLWTKIRMSWEMWRRPADILFVPAHVLPPFRPEHSVVTVHDVGFRRYPQFYKPIQKLYHERSTKDIVRSRARIIAPSEFTGRELVDLYHADASRIAITHLGIDHALYRPIEDGTAIQAVLGKYRIPRPYFLYIGRLEEKKNIVNLIKAFDVFKKHRGVGDPTVLVLAGPKGYGYEAIKKQISDSPNQKQIMEIGYVPEADVPHLLSGARGYIQISWYEGFGIPPVQAMACGCPVIAANNSAMPEILGEGNALFVSPKGIDAIAQSMDHLIANEGLVRDLREKGIRQAKNYTWEKTAKETLPVITQWLGMRRS